MVWRLICVAQFYGLLVVYTYLGLTPHPENSVPVFNDLLMHFCGYFIAAFSISFARPLWPWWQRAALLVAYSFAIEVAQHFNPPRTFSLADMLANTSGVLLGLLCVEFFSRFIKIFAWLRYWKTQGKKNSPEHG